MQFGIFDQNDRGPYPLSEQYEKRLALIGFYDRAGFRTYHVSEHHSTPLNLTPSPSVFLAAVTQRTRRIRLGALVYVLPMHHPLRLAEEICMLDHLSGGRIEIGIGRGEVLLLQFREREEQAGAAIHQEPRGLGDRDLLGVAMVTALGEQSVITYEPAMPHHQII